MHRSRPGRGSRAWAIVRVLRPSQWVKNSLLFAPPIAASGLRALPEFGPSLLAFAAFCLAASGVYVFNDLLDAEEDRRNPETASRPIASGELGSRGAILLILALLICSGLASMRLPPSFGWLLGLYGVLMLLYSLILKRVAVLDVLVLSAGYSIRLAAGASASQIAMSPWPVALCGALFLSLALLKRYVSVAAAARNGSGATTVRGYRSIDAPVLASQGIASGYIAVLVLALYASSDAARTHYRDPWKIWALCVLLVYWLNYMWLMARRGVIPHDPVGFALRDRVSLTLIAGMTALALAAF